MHFRLKTAAAVVLALLAVLPGLAAAGEGFMINPKFMPQGTIALSHPAAGAKWRQGEEVQISWSWTGMAGGSVMITLWQGESQVAVAAPSWPAGDQGKGSITWKVPANLPPGEYQLRIRSLRDARIEDRRDVSIGPPVVEITSPFPYETWFSGDAYPIEWRYLGDIGEEVRLELLDGEGAVAAVIAASYPAGPYGYGRYCWQVPSLPAGEYRLRLYSTANPALKADSTPFRIAVPTSKDRLAGQGGRCFRESGS